MIDTDTLAQRWATAKPLAIALVVGLVAGPLISNLAGWQVTSGVASARAHEGVVEARSSVCAALARTDNAKPADLDWEARSALAKKWAVMPGDTVADSDVLGACARKLAV